MRSPVSSQVLKQILRQDVRLVVWSLLRTVRTAVVSMVRDVRDGAFDRFHEHALCVCVLHEPRRIEQPGFVFIEDVAGPRCGGFLARVRIAIGTERFREAFDERVHLGCAGGIFGGAVDAGESGDVLAERVAGDEAICVIPAPHVFAGRGQAGALAVNLQQPVIVESEKMRVDGVVLPLHRAAGQRHRSVGKFVQMGVRVRCSVKPCRERGRYTAAKEISAMEASRHGSIIYGVTGAGGKVGI